MPEEQSTRDRVRALVREVLENAAPANEPEGARGSTPSAVASGTPSDGPRARIVNVVAEPPAAPEQEYARDESSK
ncbi:MAG: hypothetical protein H7Z38_17130, partial [Rubrivivax sp.]|nr:hypothetical protein [Pyrinomonadaceae bacterium]